MAGTKERARQLWDSAKRMWKVVKPVKDHAETIAEPLETYFNAQKARDLSFYADDNLKECLNLAIGLRLFTKRFQANGNDRWKSSADIIGEFTSAGYGRKNDNIVGQKKLQDLVTFAEQLKSIATTGKSLTEAIYATLLVTTADVTIQGGNATARKKAVDQFNGVSIDVDKFLPNLRQAKKNVDALVKNQK